MFKHLFKGRLSGLPLAWMPVFTIVVIVAYAIIVPIALPEDQTTVNFANAYSPPSSDYWFGTDSAGHDLFVRTAQALRISLIIAVITAIFSAIIGTMIGVTAALAGGFLDRLTMRFVDGMNALPHLILVLVVVSLFQRVGHRHRAGPRCHPLDSHRSYHPSAGPHHEALGLHPGRLPRWTRPPVGNRTPSGSRRAEPVRRRPCFARPARYLARIDLVVPGCRASRTQGGAGYPPPRCSRRGPPGQLVDSGVPSIVPCRVLLSSVACGALFGFRC